MPYADQSLPFSGSVPLSRHTSADGARDAAPRACRQTRQLLRLLAASGEEGLTDWESARLMGIERTSVNARRAPLCAGDDPWVITTSTRPGPTGVRNAAWRLSIAGSRAVAAMEAA